MAGRDCKVDVAWRAVWINEYFGVCVENMYKEYTGLGGNGLVTGMVERLRALPCADIAVRE
jgi:hypothetical protein